ncbi:hypothetical protein ACFXOS_02525 [Streptomyces sp. NPDC059175]|uniref:hypothetical protein n=1 Tax=Streptomyces sp. NPDC059175 TaxID=3346757 RepID=UPI003673C860
MTEEDREPLFLRTERGRGRYVHNYVYNPRNPLAVALVIATAVGVIGYFSYEFAALRWSGAELRRAVHEAARDLEDRPQEVSLFSTYEVLVADAVRATGEGPEHGVVHVERRTDEHAGSGGASKRAEDAFEIWTDDTEETYCMRISPPEPRTGPENTTARLSVRVAQGRC